MISALTREKIYETSLFLLMMECVRDLETESDDKRGEMEIVFSYESF